MAKRKPVKKAVKGRFDLSGVARKIFKLSLAKVGLAVGFAALSMLYNGKGLNYYLDPIMRGFPLAILTLEEGGSCMVGAVCIPPYYQIILLSILVDAIFYYLLMNLLILTYAMIKGRHRNG